VTAVGRKGGASGSARGAEGEAAAAAWLAGRGWKILARNFRCRTGEVDIVAEDGETLVFVEVKTWAALGEADLEYAVGRVKQRKIIAAARWFLAGRPEAAGKRVRFDVVLMAGGPAGIRHIEGAFSGARDEWYG
jgi:putative endonuclease